MQKLNGKIELSDKSMDIVIQILRSSPAVWYKALQAVENNRISEVQFKDILNKCANGEITEKEALSLLE